MRCRNCNTEYNPDNFPVCPICLTPNEPIVDSDLVDDVDSVEPDLSDKQAPTIHSELQERIEEESSIESDTVTASESGLVEKDSLIAESENNEKIDIIIDALDQLSQRSKNALHRCGVFTFFEMKKAYLSGDLEKASSIGKSTLEEVASLIQNEPEFYNNGRTPLNIVFYQGKYKPFLDYCNSQGIEYVDELNKVDFFELPYVKGISVAKANEIIKIIRDLPKSISDIKIENVEKNKTIVDEILLSNISNEFDNVRIDVLHIYGVKNKGIRELIKTGRTTVGALRGIKKSSLMLVVGKDNAETIINCEPIFNNSLVAALEEYLKSKTDDEQFAIVLKRADKYTLQEIGEQYNVTRERIRQREGIFLKSLDVFMEPLVDQKFALKGYITLTDILDIYDNDDYDKVLVQWILHSKHVKRLPGTSFYFSENIDVNAIYSNLLQIAEDTISDGVQWNEKLISEIEENLEKYDYGFFDLDAFTEFLVNNGYKKYKHYIIKGRVSYGYLCEKVISKYFKNGIKLYESEDLDKLRDYVDLEFGDIGLSSDNRALSTRIIDYTVLSGRGKVISPDNIHVEMNMLEEIKAYIDSAPEAEIYYSDLYARFEGIITMFSNIDNHHFLHGVLRLYFPNEYDYTRDCLRKRGNNLISGRLTDRLKAYIKEVGRPVTKNEVLSKFPGVTDVVLYNSLICDDNLFLWDHRTYYSLELIDCEPDLLVAIENEIHEIMQHNYEYCSDGMIFHSLKEKQRAFLECNHIETKTNLFYVLSKLLSEKYAFKKPHICPKGAYEEVTVENIIKHVLGDPDEISYALIHDVSERFMWANVTVLATFAEFSADYIRIDADRYIKRELFSVSESVLSAIKNTILAKMNDGYLSLINYDSFDEYPDFDYEWNVFLLRSIVDAYFDDFRVVETEMRDRRYERGIIVASQSGIFDYVDLVIDLIRHSGKDAMLESDLAALLVLRDLTYKMIPQELYENNDRLEFKEGWFTIRKQ